MSLLEEKDVWVQDSSLVSFPNKPRLPQNLYSPSVFELVPDQYIYGSSPRLVSLGPKYYQDFQSHRHNFQLQDNLDMLNCGK